MNGGPFTYYVITDGGGGLKNHKIPFILDREIGGGGRKSQNVVYVICGPLARRGIVRIYVISHDFDGT